MKKLLMILAALLVNFSWLSADTLRTNLVGVAAISADNPEGSSFDIKYNDAVGVVFAENSLFIQALEIEIRIPRQFSGQESSVAWAIYSRVSPVPALNQLDYTVHLIATQPLPARVNFVLQLPVRSDHKLRSSAFASLIPQITGMDQFPLLFKLLPAGKGLATALAEQTFRLTIRPVLTDDGLLIIDHPMRDSIGDSAIRVFLNDKLTVGWAKPLLLPKGLYNVRIAVDNYREEIYSVLIEPGKTVRLAANPLSDAPTISFEVPQGTRILLNGTAVDSTEKSLVMLDIGEQTVECTIGDYTLIRKFSAVRGRHYKVVMTVDLQIKTE